VGFNHASKRHVALALASTVALTPAILRAAECALEPGPTRAVTRVLDSETIALDDGTEVRLVGALGPRLLDEPDETALWEPEREARAELERLTLGKSVELAFSGRRTDRYGRLLAQVFVAGSERQWVQQQMVRRGHARAYAFADNAQCTTELLADEWMAREKRLGLWANAAYQVRHAESVRDLLRYRSTFQIVEGRVARVTDVRGQVFINFGRDWREDFTARARTADLNRWGLDARSLEGRRVEVRGWIERRSGPAIELRHASQISVLAD